MSRSIALFGMMGCGKTTVAAAIGGRLGRAVVDTDAEVERVVGRRIAELFADEGEASFRRHERAAVASVSGRRDLVLSLGGGAVLDDANVAALRPTCVLVELRAPVATLVARLEAEAGERPLLAGTELAARVAALTAERAPRYVEVADVRVDATGPPDEVAGVLLERLAALEDVLTTAERGRVATP